MSVLLLDVWRAARARSVPFSGESAGYVALGLCEALERDPRAIDLSAIELGADGGLRVVRGEPCSDGRAEVIVRGMLGALLSVASSPGPALFRAAGRDPGAGVAALTTELKKALIPVNRAAARRALLRLCRETERAAATGKLAPAEDLGAPAESSAPRVVTPPPLPVSSPSSLRVVSPPPLPVAPVAAPAPSVAVAATVRAVPEPVALPVPALRLVVSEPPSPVAPAVALAAAAPVFASPVLGLPELVIELEPEPEHLTSAETVVARVRRRVRSTPPPLPPSDRHSSTPRIGSLEIADAAPRAARTPSPPPLPVWPDATERAPQVREYAGEPFELCASVIDAVPVVELVTDPRVIPAAVVPERATALPEVEAVPIIALEAVPEILEVELEASQVVSEVDVEPEPELEVDAELAPDADAEERAIAVALAIAEASASPELNESPALVVGVHVDDTEEAAELVDDDDIETRPLLGRLPPVPYAGMPLRQSDVGQLISGFQVGGGIDETELRRELKALAGVDLTPAQPSAARPR